VLLPKTKQNRLHQRASNLDDDNNDLDWVTIDLHRGRDYAPEDGDGIDDVSLYVKHRLNQARRLAMLHARYQA
jgi:hypothetical protein